MQDSLIPWESYRQIHLFPCLHITRLFVLKDQKCTDFWGWLVLSFTHIIFQNSLFKWLQSLNCLCLFLWTWYHFILLRDKLIASVLWYSYKQITLQTFLPNGSGNYSFRAEPGNYKLRIDAAPLPFLYACPFNGIDSVILTPINSHVDSVDFSVACNVYADYVSNSITPSTQFRPNHFVELYMNAGEISQNFSGNCFSEIILF